MPVYLFTYHIYGSWMPDREQGYVVRGKGIQRQDHQAANQYRSVMPQDAVMLEEDQQHSAIESVQEGVQKIDATLHAVATEPTHFHYLLSWKSDRLWEKVRTSIKGGITKGLKKRYGDKIWLSRGASRKQVHDQSHCDYLLKHYFPKHSGWKWDLNRGFYR